MVRALLVACTVVVPALAFAACSSEEDRPLPLSLVGPGLDGAVSCSELRDAAQQDSLSTDGAGPPCAVNGIECALETPGDASRCADGKLSQAECFGQRWRVGCVDIAGDATATP
jgi:hypothetical protein